MTRHKLPDSGSDASRLPRLFALSSSLAVLQADATVRLMPFQRHGLPEAGWIMGIKPISDTASVHGNHWERHPRGDEILTLLEGSLRVVLAADEGDERELEVAAGESLVVPQGWWHRLEVHRPGRLMFVTPATDSEHRPRRPRDQEN
ncbi:Cupin domain protein [Pigmentiphaga humi]|uniref:Cupin domain protein n=1 Tax=Pigmentiphaga humi TaxID=2478468 RepID=A0A3P4B528_9BURK|nr:cupin domain-containing protein [Pigmentiphaga humi]VCU71397.1 Cupin domain protein [Pigmentiphaga humi]